LPSARVLLFVGIEAVAGVAAFVTSAQTDASVERQLGIAATVVGLLASLWVVARFVLRPLLHQWIFAVLAAEQGKLTDTVIEALDKNERARSTTRGFVDRLYADTLKEQQETKDLAEANRDRLVFLEESQARMGESLTKDFGAAVRESTRSNEQQTQLMREIQLELRKLSEAYVRLDERFNSIYDGPERRKHPR
jgi:hypothetical protein